MDDDASDPSESDAPRARRESEDEDGVAARRKPDEERETADDDPRARAQRRYREIRDREAAAAQAQQQAPETEPDDQETAPSENADENSDAVSEQKSDEKPKTVKLKVHGKEEEVSLEEVISLAQIAKASDNLLDVAKSRASEATRLLKEAQEAQQRLRDGTEHPPASKAASKPNPSEGQPDPEHPPVAGLDPDKLREIAERIQVGDAAEGAEALKELLSEMATKASKPAITPDEIDQRVESRIRHQRTQEELDKALQDFGKEFPDVMGKRLLADAGRTALRDELVKDLRSAGLPDEQIEAASRDDNALVAIHRDLRSRKNPSVRAYSDLFKATGKALSDEFGLKPKSAQKSTPPPAKAPAPQRPVSDPARVQERIDRKRAAPQQPRAAGVRAPVAQPPQQPSTRDVVAMMRRQRGFSPTR